jgi:hypothetical protein
MSVQTVARRYASALADVVLERGEAAEVKEELVSWEKMLRANPMLEEVLRNPTIALDKFCCRIRGSLNSVRLTRSLRKYWTSALAWSRPL